jgi:4-hydroxy-tetrahydrodipicolinate synthase
MQIQGGLDGFIGIEKYLLQKRGVFSNTLQRHPVGWQMDLETQAEVDRLFDLLLAVL